MPREAITFRKKGKLVFAMKDSKVVGIMPVVDGRCTPTMVADNLTPAELKVITKHADTLNVLRMERRTARELT
jgi:hypothetical protein